MPLMSYGCENSCIITFSMSPVWASDQLFRPATGPDGRWFESIFDALTYWAMTGQIEPTKPTIILNSGRLAARGAEMISTRIEWQGVELWRVWQHADDEGHRVTGVICDEISGQRQVGTMESYYEGYNDLNEFWTNAPDQQRGSVRAQFQGERPQQKAYDSSATSEARRTHEARLTKSTPKLF